MLQLPSQPKGNDRALAQVYREEFTGLTVATVTLSYTPCRTVNNVGMEAIYRNGVLLGLTGHASAPASVVPHRETQTGMTGATLTLAATPVPTSELVFKNGAALFPGGDYSITGDTVTLSSAAVSGDHFVISYGITSTGSPSSLGTSYMIDGKTITLDEALVAADVVVAVYYYRA